MESKGFPSLAHPADKSRQTISANDAAAHKKRFTPTVIDFIPLKLHFDVCALRLVHFEKGALFETHGAGYDAAGEKANFGIVFFYGAVIIFSRLTQIGFDALQLILKIYKLRIESVSSGTLRWNDKASNSG